MGIESCISMNSQEKRNYFLCHLQQEASVLILFLVSEQTTALQAEIHC